MQERNHELVAFPANLQEEKTDLILDPAGLQKPDSDHSPVSTGLVLVKTDLVFIPAIWNAAGKDLVLFPAE